MIILNNSVSLRYDNVYNYVSKNIQFPIFQRGYAWKKDEAVKFLEDIMTLAYLNISERKMRQLYLLDFIWYDDNNVMNIADGQQRLVTLNILIACINEYLAVNKPCINQLQYFSLSYEDDDTQEKYNKFFNNKKRATAPFASMYKFMTIWIKEHNAYIDDIIDVIKNNIYIYLKEASNVDDAFAVFTQINSGGKPLTKDDVIKTTIKQYSHKYCLPVDNFDFKDIKNLINSYYKLYSSNTGNVTNLAIMQFMNQNIVNSQQSFKQFHGFMNSVKDINKHAIYHVVNYIGKSQLINVIYALCIKGIDITQKREYLEKILLPLCLMSIIWKMKKTNPGGVVASLFTNIIKAIQDDKAVDDIRAIIITFVQDNASICKISINEFASCLDCNFSRDAKKALLIMDVIQRNTSGYLNVSSINLEHIYPQNPCDDWVLNGWPGTED